MYINWVSIAAAGIRDIESRASRDQMESIDTGSRESRDQMESIDTGSRESRDLIYEKMVSLANSSFVFLLNFKEGSLFSDGGTDLYNSILKFPKVQ